METTPATAAGITIIPAIHAHLAGRGLLPADHLVASRTLALRSPGGHLRLTATASWIRQQYLE